MLSRTIILCALLSAFSSVTLGNDERHENVTTGGQQNLPSYPPYPYSQFGGQGYPPYGLQYDGQAHQGYYPPGGMYPPVGHRPDLPLPKPPIYPPPFPGPPGPPPFPIPPLFPPHFPPPLPPHFPPHVPPPFPPHFPPQFPFPPPFPHPPPFPCRPPGCPPPFPPLPPPIDHFYCSAHASFALSMIVNAPAPIMPLPMPLHPPVAMNRNDPNVGVGLPPHHHIEQRLVETRQFCRYIAVGSPLSCLSCCQMAARHFPLSEAEVTGLLLLFDPNKPPQPEHIIVGASVRKKRQQSTPPTIGADQTMPARRADNRRYNCLCCAPKNLFSVHL